MNEITNFFNIDMKPIIFSLAIIIGLVLIIYIIKAVIDINRTKTIFEMKKKIDEIDKKLDSLLNK